MGTDDDGVRNERSVNHNSCSNFEENHHFAFHPLPMRVDLEGRAVLLLDFVLLSLSALKGLGRKMFPIRNRKLLCVHNFSCHDSAILCQVHYLAHLQWNTHHL